MSLVSYRCPNTNEEVVTVIVSDEQTLARMQSAKLSMWAWRPHCMAGHQINANEAKVSEAAGAVLES